MKNRKFNGRVQKGIAAYEWIEKGTKVVVNGMYRVIERIELNEENTNRKGM